MKKTYLTRGWVVGLLAVICCALWGSAITTIKKGYFLMGIDSSDTASIILFAGLRFTLAGVLVIIFECIHQKKVIRLAVRTIKLAFLLCLAQIAYALSTVLINKFSQKEAPVLLSGSQFFLGGFLLTGVGFCMGGRIHEITSGAILILLYLAFVSAVAYTLWSVLLAYNEVSRVAIYGFVNPLCSVLLSAAVLGEIAQAFNAGTLAALLLVSVGICIVNWKLPQEAA